MPPAGAEQPPSLQFVLWEIAGALVVGAVLGAATTLYVRFIKRELLVFSVIVALLGVEIARVAHVELLLTLLAAGFVTANVSRTGEELIHSVERAAAPIFVVFFALSGAAINMPEVWSIIGVVVPLVVLRIISIWAGTTFAARRSRLEPQVANRVWLGLVAQMGVAIGLASVIGGVYPRIGPSVQTIALAVIAINQLIGPVFFKRALTLSGELPSSPREHAPLHAPPETALR
jgi:Kef-type K+ transport system membrane component KefB